MHRRNLDRVLHCSPTICISEKANATPGARTRRVPFTFRTALGGPGYLSGAPGNLCLRGRDVCGSTAGSKSGPCVRGPPCAHLAFSNPGRRREVDWVAAHLCLLCLILHDPGKEMPLPLLGTCLIRAGLAFCKSCPKEAALLNIGHLFDEKYERCLGPRATPTLLLFRSNGLGSDEFLQSRFMPRLRDRKSVV